MRSLMIVAALAAVLAPAGTADAQPRRQAGELRCGWLENPTPANWWLRDRQGEWTIQQQGQSGPRGWDDLQEDFSQAGWVETNGSHGYGCACMRVDVNRRTMRVTRVYSAQGRPLAQCRRDRSLPRPG